MGNKYQSRLISAFYLLIINFKMPKIIKVTFTLKRNYSANLKNEEYFVETDDQAIAHEKALCQLNYELGAIALKIRTSGKELLRYYDNVSFAEINIIK